MAKIIRAFFIFLVIVTAGICSQVDARIKKFDDNFVKANKTVKLELHQDMKGLYIKSIIDNDNKNKIEALKRLVRSSKALGLGANPYEKELESLIGVKEKDNISKQDSKSDSKQTVKKDAKTEKNPTITVKKDDLKKPLQILQIIQNANNLEIRLSRAIDESEIKHFRLNAKDSFRNVYDFKGAWISKSHTFKNVISDEVRVSQFDKNTIRIVFSNKKEQKLQFAVDQNSIFFALAGQNMDISTSGDQQKTKQKKDAKSDKKQNEDKISDKKVLKNKSSVAFGKIIVLDAGHGGDDPGAINGKLQEKNIVLSIALKAGDELKSRGYKVFYTRSKDKFINLRDRTKFANDKLADLFISIHANAAPNKQKAASMQGVETFFLSPARSERSKNVAALENKSDIEEMNYFSKQTFLNFLNREKIIASNKLAIDIQRDVLARAKKINSKVSDGGVREAPFWVLVGALMPAILLEVGYITHPDEGVLMSKSNYQEAIAKGIADGIDQYFTNQQQ